MTNDSFLLWLHHVTHVGTCDTYRESVDEAMKKLLLELLVIMTILCGVGSIVYGSWAVAVSRQTLNCVRTMQQEAADQTKDLRVQSKLRADALYRVLNQRLDLSNLKPIEDPKVQAAWSDFRTAHKRYNLALAQNPAPDPDKCS